MNLTIVHGGLVRHVRGKAWLDHDHKTEHQISSYGNLMLCLLLERV